MQLGSVPFFTTMGSEISYLGSEAVLLHTLPPYTASLYIAIYGIAAAILYQSVTRTHLMPHMILTK